MDEMNFFKAFFEKYNKEMEQMSHVNLIIAGKTGTGKSTLLNAALGEDFAKTGIGKPITNEAGTKCFEKQGGHLRIYDTIGLELDEQRRKSSLEAIKKICKDAKQSMDMDKTIHAMWYCVGSESDRLESFEADYINSIAEDVPVILVITKTYRKKHAKRLQEAIEKEYPVLDIANFCIVLAQDEDLEDCDEGEMPKKAFGVDTLVEMTEQIIPEAVQKVWCSIQKASINMKVSRAQKVVLATAGASFGEGYLPLPFSDALALVPTQLGMLASITAIFGISVSEDLLKSIVSSMAGTAGATFVGRTVVANLLKMIPVAGTVVGGTINGTTAALLTTALGEAYIKIMKMIVKGELKEKDLQTKAGQDKMKELFEENLKKKSK